MRLRAARSAVQAVRRDCRIIARTEALVAGMGVPEALRRAKEYVEAGADAVFVQSLDATGGEVLTFGRAWKSRTPLFIAPTRMPKVTRTEFKQAGISHQIFANQGIRAAHKALERTFGALSEAESSFAAEQEISSVRDVAGSVGAHNLFAMEAGFRSNGAVAHGAKAAGQVEARRKRAKV